eukprot:jgi/Tetstr1/458022/TSEL_044531.t1
MRQVAKDIDPELSFDLVEQVTMVGGGLATATAAAAACPPCPDFCQLRTRCEAYTPFPVNLRWLKSAQFAGFYAAEALGDFLLYAVRQKRDVFHVSQYFRRPGFRWWTSPVVDVDRTIGINGYADLEDVIQCTPATLRLDANLYSLLIRHKKTACGYEDPRTGQLVECSGGESIRFHKCNFGIEEVMGQSQTELGGAAHVMHGMVYDQLGQMLSTVVNGSLYTEGDDFRVFNFADDGIFNMEDGLMVNRTWLQEPANEETLIRFIKGLHKGWIYCRDNALECAKLVSANNEGDLHQIYQMHEASMPP